MKPTIVAIFLIPACFVLACGTNKKDTKDAAEIDNQSDPSAPYQIESNLNCEDSPHQSQNCSNFDESAVRIQVIQAKSWLNPRFRADGSLQTDDGICLNKFMASKADDKALTFLEMDLTRMELKNGAAHCRMHVRVAYKKGYTFTIRKVEVPLMGRIPVGSSALFDGSYSLAGKKPLVMQRTVESGYSNKPMRLVHSALDHDTVWSSCSGQDTVIVDTKLSLNFNRSSQDGDLRIEGTTPYRFEVLWAKCQ
jgi:hypothetical protein